MLLTSENSCITTLYNTFRQHLAHLAHYHAVNCLPLSALDLGFELNVLSVVSRQSFVRDYIICFIRDIPIKALKVT